MKKILTVFFLMVLFFAVTVEKAFTRDFSLEASVQAGISKLNTKEKLLYQNNSELYTLSLLDWDTNIVPCISADVLLGLTNTFYIKAGGQFTLPVSQGTMKDYDWQNVLSTGSTGLTNYSEHKSTLDSFYNAELGFGLGGDITDSIRLIQFFSVRYSYQSVTAKNGWRQYAQIIDEQNGNNVYGPWTNDIEKKAMSGKSVTLEAQDIFLGLGTQLNFQFSDDFSAKLFINILPSLYSQALDTHYKRDIYTLFDFSSKLEFNADVLLEYKLNNANSITAKAGFGAAKADNADVFQNSKKLDSYPGAATATCWSFLLGYTYRYEK